MTQPHAGTVTVRVEVVIEGAHAAERVAFGTEPLSLRHHPVPLLIQTPLPAPNPTPVIKIAGANYIAASGVSPPIGSTLPPRVWAQAYPTPVLTSVPGSPPSTAALDTPPDASWSFTQAKGNLVPGSACDTAGKNNSTLVVWYDYGGSPTVYSTETTPFYGYGTGGSGGPVSPLLARSAQFHPTTLHATFTGKLAPLGTVTLKSNGAGWSGHASGKEAAVFSFQDFGGTFQLQCLGPATAFVVTAPPARLQPFNWAARGEAFGPLAGEFEVTIVE